MDLIFEETKDRQQCGSETVVNGLKIRCFFLSSKLVTIPTGVHYFDGKLDYSESMLRVTIPICKNHEMKLKNDFGKLSGKNT